MKRISIIAALVCFTLAGFAQEKADTIKIGGMVIIKKSGKKDEEGNKEYRFKKRKPLSPQISEPTGGLLTWALPIIQTIQIIPV